MSGLFRFGSLIAFILVVGRRDSDYFPDQLHKIVNVRRRTLHEGKLDIPVVSLVVVGIAENGDHNTVILILNIGDPELFTGYKFPLSATAAARGIRKAAIPCHLVQQTLLENAPGALFRIHDEHSITEDVRISFATCGAHLEAVFVQKHNISGGDNIVVCAIGLCKLDLRDQFLFDQRGRVADLGFHPDTECRRH